MGNFQQTLQAMKSMDFEALEQLLDDDISYMDVSKELFLGRLKQKLNNQVNKGFNGYDEIIVGTCNNCNKGCNAYSFYAKDFPSLDLFFDVKDDTVKDIMICHDLKGVKKNEDLENIYFHFFEDEKVAFRPNSTYVHTKREIDNAIERLSIYLNKPISLNDIKGWQEPLKKHSNLNDPLDAFFYKAFDLFHSVYRELDNLKTCFERNEEAKKAILDYNKVRDNEEELVKWYFDYRDIKVSGDFKTVHFDKESSFIHLKMGLRLKVKDEDCLHSILFYKAKGKAFSQLFQKYYTPLEGNGINNLEDYLRHHKMYLNILPG